MQVIGICRFSYPGIGGFQVKHDSIDARRAYLYAQHRMEERFRIFETITLPPLRAQSDQNFTFLVVTGNDLPTQYRDRLKALLEDIPQAIVFERAAGKHRKVMQDAINSVRTSHTDPNLQFRMDDDDAVACTYVERLREAALDSRTILAKHRHIAIDFNQGFIVGLGPRGIAATPTKTPYTTAALALMFQPDVPQSVMNFAHAKVAHNMPTVTFSGEDMLLRSYNNYNDSRQRPSIRPVILTPLDATGEAHFKSVYNIDSDHVRRVFSGS
ncbi:MAG: putative rhamnosyl transferase [Paracoccaceae bacterium]